MTKHLMLCLLLMMMLAGCSSRKKSAEIPDAHKYLVVYYSQTGATQAVAHELARQLEADTLCINLEQLTTVRLPKLSNAASRRWLTIPCLSSARLH